MSDAAADLTNETNGVIGISNTNDSVVAMARSLPPLTWFRAFECAARHLNFTAAADELGLTQSAVSQQVRSLEMRFGVSLFQRQPRGLSLTDDGRRLLPDVTAAIGSLRTAAEIFETGPTAGLLTVATSVSFSQWYLAPNLQSFTAANPDLRVRVVGTIWPDEFHAAIADVEIRFGTKAMVGTGAQRLLPDRLIAVASPRLAVERDGLAEHALIEAVGTSGGWASWAKHVRYPQHLEPGLFVDSHGLAVDLARSGAGVAMTSSLIAAPSLREGSLRQVHPQAIANKDGYFLAVRKNTDGSADRFAAWLKRQIRSSTQDT